MDRCLHMLLCHFRISCTKVLRFRDAVFNFCFDNNRYLLYSSYNYDTIPFIDLKQGPL